MTSTDQELYPTNSNGPYTMQMDYKDEVNDDKLSKIQQHKLMSHSMIPRAFNTPEEVVQLISAFGVHKCDYGVGRLLLNGMLAGFFVALGGFISMTLAGGVSNNETDPYLPKLLAGATFPVALVLIVFFGGDLFTGNTMVLFVSWCHRRISIVQILKNWTIIFLANLLGAVGSALVLGYWAELYDQEPWLSYVHHTAQKKVHMSFAVAFCRGIGANALVCAGIFLGLCCRESAGKLFALWAPVFTFAVAGYEHSIANMFYISLGMFYHAPGVNYYDFFIRNLLPVSLGNIVGGAFVMGGSQYLLYTDHQPSNSILYYLIEKLKSK